MTSNDNKVSLYVTDPREDVTENEIKEVMDLIVEKNIFAPNGEDIVSAKEAKIVQTEISPKQTEYTLSVISGAKDNIKVEIEPLVINSTQSEGFTCEVYLPKYLFAPVKNGEVLGKAVYKQNGKVVFERKITSKEAVPLTKFEKKTITKVLENFLYIAKFI